MLYANKLQNQRLKRLWVQVLDKLPNEVSKVVLRGLTIRDVQELCSEAPSPYAKFSTGDGTITLSINALQNCDDLVVKGFIAHELAHPYQLRTCQESRNVLDDSTIDQIARNWGFGREIEAMRKTNPLN